MSDFKSRLSDEAKELNDKVAKLNEFIWSEKIEKVSDIQRILLRAQSAAMHTYSLILEERIKNL